MRPASEAGRQVEAAAAAARLTLAPTDSDTSRNVAEEQEAVRGRRAASSSPERSCATTGMKAGIVPGGAGSLCSTWPSGPYIPQSRNRCPRRTPLGSWLGTPDEHPHGPPGAPAGPSPLEVVQAENGPHLRPPFLRGWVGVGGVTRPLTGGRELKPDHRCRLTPLPVSCRRGDRCKGAGLAAQVRANIIKSESRPGRDLCRV